MDTSTLDKVIEQMKVMPPDLQWQVLEFVRALAGSSSIQGVPGQQLLRFAGTILLDDIDLMREAIEDCEQVDINEW
jgi:hypothetical protein